MYTFYLSRYLAPPFAPPNTDRINLLERNQSFEYSSGDWAYSRWSRTKSVMSSISTIQSRAYLARASPRRPSWIARRSDLIPAGSRKTKFVAELLMFCRVESNRRAIRLIYDH